LVLNGVAEPPPLQQPSPRPPGHEALTTAAEFIKYFTALATGALVFSAGLVSDKITLTPIAQWLLTASWALIAASVLGGVLAYARIPIQLAAATYDLEDKWLTYPARGQQVAFILSMLCLAAALFSALTAPSVAGANYQIPSAIAAVREARKHVPAAVSPWRLVKVESIAGIDERNPDARVWHVTLESEPPQGSAPSCTRTRVSVDVLLDAKTRKVQTIP